MHWLGATGYACLAGRVFEWLTVSKWMAFWEVDGRDGQDIATRRAGGVLE